MCVFCEIVKGNIPSYKIYEDEKCIAILDISQATKGHTLVIPKEHYDNILDIDESLLSHLHAVAKKVALHYSNKLETNNFNILNNCGPVAGQTVNHFHIHVIPRYENDDLKIEFTEHNTDKDEFQLLLNDLILK